jgi:hypothetical protein
MPMTVWTLLFDTWRLAGATGRTAAPITLTGAHAPAPVSWLSHARLAAPERAECWRPWGWGAGRAPTLLPAGAAVVAPAALLQNATPAERRRTALLLPDGAAARLPGTP